MTEPDSPPETEEERRTTFLELFFDLVLVFAITQIATILHDAPHHHPGHALTGWAQAGLIAGMIWWLWSQFAWLGTSVDLSAPRPRVWMLSLTGFMLIAAIALPVALEPGVSVFGITYAIIKLGALYLYQMDADSDAGHMAAVRVYLRNASVAPLLVLVASFLPPELRAPAWTVALALEIVGTLLSGRQAFRISASHFAERHALVLIVVLGEAVVALGGKAVPGALGVTSIGGLLGGFGLIAALWWSYFGWAFGATEGWLRGHGRPFAPGDIGAAARMARDAFTLGHFPLMSGVIAIAVGLKDLAAAPLEPWNGDARIAMSVGLVLYLGGFVAVVYRGNGYVLWERLAALVLMVATAQLSNLPAGATAALLGAELLVAIWLEVRRWSRLQAARAR